MTLKMKIFLLRSRRFSWWSESEDDSFERFFLEWKMLEGYKRGENNVYTKNVEWESENS
jgi:hypothetical protein